MAAESVPGTAAEDTARGRHMFGSRTVQLERYTAVVSGTEGRTARRHHTGRAGHIGQWPLQAWTGRARDLPGGARRRWRGGWRGRP